MSSPDPAFSKEAGMILLLQGPRVHIPPFLPSPFFPPATRFEQAIFCQRRPVARSPKERSCWVKVSWAPSAPWAMQTVTSCWDQTSLQLCLEAALGSKLNSQAWQTRARKSCLESPCRRRHGKQRITSEGRWSSFSHHCPPRGKPWFAVA